MELDVAQFPNSFKGVAKTTFIDSNADFIGMVDGGEDDEVIPIQPLLVQARKVDVILAVDGVSSFHISSMCTDKTYSWYRAAT